MSRIIDVSKELQTDKLKLLIFRQIEQFVYKYQPRYYKQYQGDLKELAYDLFEEFIRPKKHRNGEVYSELDRMDPSVVGNGQWTGDENKAIATYTQRFVAHSLIDKSRTDKGEVLATENYDDKQSTLTFDRIASGNTKRSTGDDGMVGGAYVENVNNTFYDLMENEIALKNMERRLSKSPSQAKYIAQLIKHYGDRLDPDVKEFAAKLAEKYAPKQDHVDISEVEQLTGAKVERQPLQKKPAMRLEFASKEDALAVDREKLDALLNEYTFYKVNGNKMYYFLNVPED